MVDPVGIAGLTLQILTDILPKIMKEVDRVRQNKEDCLRIKKRAEMISHTLSLCESNVEVMNNPDATASGEPIRVLHDILVEARATVTDCQALQEAAATSAEHMICFFCRARKISKRLRKLERDIAYSHADASFAILVFLLVFRTENLAHHLQPESSSQVTNSKPASFMVYQISKHTQHTSSPRREVQEQTHVCGDYPPSQDGLPADTQHTISIPPTEQPTSPYDKMGDQPRSPVVRIAKLAAKTKAEAEKARQNKEECIEIATRLNKVSELLSRFEKTEMMKDPAMSIALSKLDEIFSRAHMLITACQTSNIVTMFLPWRAKKLRKQLREVFDQMLLQLDGVIAVGFRTIEKKLLKKESKQPQDSKQEHKERKESGEHNESDQVKPISWTSG